MKISKSYNVNIYVGLKETYSSGKVHSISEVESVCRDFVDKEKACVSVTPTCFYYCGGMEHGAIVGFINYPRFPTTKREIRNKALLLSKKLMIALNQYRVTITCPDNSYMLENKNVER